ncbi:hypothetical protein BDF20DRAFT_338256 [Mycotypha africana]|uniref:uncharacterized protein n=1 Tax=Mycotypha africana TaxID=64632 RepID=UPI002300D069|nr:uncharacterized protein BDF20DRAFT_338256 [Mycotypha africana]KAI8988543.1 hypothetical protein BDF20DRAFT_338256 [Mycotypha africana]
MDLPAYQFMDTVNDMDILSITQNQYLQQQQRQLQQQHLQTEYQKYYSPSTQPFRQQPTHANTSASVETYSEIPITNLSILAEHTNDPSASIPPFYTPSYSSYYSFSADHGQGASTPQFTSAAKQDTYKESQQQEDLATPLISPTTSPSFVCQVKRQIASNVNNETALKIATNETGLSPLSSPAIQPKAVNYPLLRQNSDRHQRAAFQQKYIDNGNGNGNGNSEVMPNNNTSYDAISSSNSSYSALPTITTSEMTDMEIEEEYERLEQAKQFIKQRLTVLQQKSQQGDFQRTNNSRPSQQTFQTASTDDVCMMFTADSPSSQQTQTFVNSYMHGISSSRCAFNIKPATPSSLMNMRMPSSSSHNKTISTQRSTSAIATSIPPLITAQQSDTVMPGENYYTTHNSRLSSISNKTAATTTMTSPPISSNITPTTTPIISAVRASGSNYYSQEASSNRITDKSAANTIITATPTTDKNPSSNSPTFTKKKRQRRITVTDEKKQKRKGSHNHSHHRRKLPQPSPRALKPLLVRSPIVTAVVGTNSRSSGNHYNGKGNTTTAPPHDNSHTNRHRSNSQYHFIKPASNYYLPTSIEDAERILATKSNYQNLIEGKAAALGIAFTTEIKSGVEVRRSAHKVAEQKRRDSLKEWFDRLRREVEDGYVKPRKSLLSQVIKAQQASMNDENSDNKDATESTSSGGSKNNDNNFVCMMQTNIMPML